MAGLAPKSGVTQQTQPRLPRHDKKKRKKKNCKHQNSFPSFFFLSVRVCASFVVVVCLFFCRYTGNSKCRAGSINIDWCSTPLVAFGDGGTRTFPGTSLLVPRNLFAVSSPPPRWNTGRMLAQSTPPTAKSSKTLSPTSAMRRILASYAGQAKWSP